MVGLTSPGHRRGLQVCDEGTASCNRNLHPSPPQHILFPASQMRELTRETATFHPPHPAFPGAGLGPWRQRC